MWVLLVLTISAKSAAQEPSDYLFRRHTAADFGFSGNEDPPPTRRLIEQFEHGKAELNVAETDFLDGLRRHIGSIPLQVQKESAYDFMRIRRRVVEAAHPGRAFGLMNDLQSHPNAYAGRPIVLYGRIQSISGGNGTSRPTVALLDLNTETNRVIGTIEVADVQRAAVGELPQSGLPVRVVAFLFKLDGDAPYFLANQLEWLTPRADPQDFSVVRHKTRGIRDEEATLYYETLWHARVVPLSQQQRLARSVLAARIEQRLDEATRRHARERAAADRESDESVRAEQVAAADRKLTLERRRHERYAGDPSTFPLFADVFVNPDLYLGKPVTMSGHVREVMDYAADPDRWGPNQTLYELWLYPEDSQHNPAVVICPSLPDGFPRDGEVINNVTVTGTFFKLYRYAAGDANRAAPLLLAQRVRWQPVTAQAAGFGWVGKIATVLCIFGCAALLLYLWTTHGADNRAREVLLRRQTAMPEDLNPDLIAPGFSPSPVPARAPVGGLTAERPVGLHEETRDTALSVAESVRSVPLRSDVVVGAAIKRVIQKPDPEAGHGIELSNGHTLTLNNDVIDLQESCVDGESNPDFAILEGFRLNQVVVDQWDRVYLIVGNDLFVTEDFGDDGARVLIYGNVSELVGEEPDLRLCDYWTKQPVARD